MLRSLLNGLCENTQFLKSNNQLDDGSFGVKFGPISRETRDYNLNDLGISLLSWGGWNKVISSVVKLDENTRWTMMFFIFFGSYQK